MLALLLEKKETQEPVLAVLKRVLKVMVNCVIGLYPNTKEMREFGEKAGLLCSKFALGDLAKSISCIMFYY
jgi:translation initiation factor 2 beta subunit (eIF-2beta)/eIF-5